MDKLHLEPVGESYAVQPPEEVLRTALPGGAGRYRADIDGGASLVNLTFNLDAGGYDYLWRFFRAKTARGADPFLMELHIESPTRSERTCRFIPGSLQLGSRIKSSIFYVTAQIEVEAEEADDEMDESVAEVYAASHGATDDYLNLFSIIVNENWPEA